MWSARACLASSLRDLRFPAARVTGCQQPCFLSFAAPKKVSKLGAALTSDICNAENSDGTGLDDAAMVGQERCGSWLKARGAVLEVALVVVWSRLAKVSIVAQLQQCLETPILHGSPGQESR